MSKNRRLLVKIAGVFGVLIPLVAFAFIFSSILSYPQFSWTDNALSDLGIVEGVTCLLFNNGLIITGAWSLVFAAGLLVGFGKNGLGKVGALVFAFACIALISIGVFPENIKPTHYQVSVAFFVLLPISFFIISGAFAVEHKLKIALYTLATGLIAALPWVLYFTVQYVPNVAIPEFISGFFGAIWALVLGIYLIKQATKAS